MGKRAKSWQKSAADATYLTNKDDQPLRNDPDQTGSAGVWMGVGVNV